YRTAEREPGLQAAEEGVGVIGHAIERRIGRHMVVAIVTESGAVIFVRTGARGDVHGAYGGHARLHIEVEAGKLELLNRFDRIIRPRPAGHRVDYVSAVHRQSRQVGGASADRDVEEVVRVAGTSSRDAHSRFERSKLKKIPSVQRQAVNLPACDDAVN